MSDLWTDIRRALEILDELRMTIVVSPENESRVKMRVAAEGLNGVTTVVVDRHMPDDRIMVYRDQSVT